MRTSIRKIAEGAYFVPSYSEQTVLPFSGMMVSQTITVKEIDEVIIISMEEEKEDVGLIKADLKDAF